MLPAKADPEKQKEFLEQELQPRLEEAQAVLEFKKNGNLPHNK